MISLFLFTNYKQFVIWFLSKHSFQTQLNFPIFASKDPQSTSLLSMLGQNDFISSSIQGTFDFLTFINL